MPLQLVSTQNVGSANPRERFRAEEKSQGYEAGLCSAVGLSNFGPKGGELSGGLESIEAGRSLDRLAPRGSHLRHAGSTIGCLAWHLAVLQ